MDAVLIWPYVFDAGPEDNMQRKTLRLCVKKVRHSTGMFRKRALPALLLAVPLFVYLVYPLGAMLAESVTLPVSAYRAKNMGWEIDKQPVGAALITVFYDSNTREAIWGTLELALLTVVLGGAWGIALVLLWWRREFPGRRLFALLGYAPIVMPPR